MIEREPREELDVVGLESLRLFANRTASEFISAMKAQWKLESKDANGTWDLGEKKGFRREIGVGSGHRWPAGSIRIVLCPS